MLGVLDWGIGGLGFYSRLKRERPDAGVIYLSDAGSVPYGKLDRTELLLRVFHAVSFLQIQGADHVVVACNAASTVLSSLPSDTGTKVTGIIDSGVETVKRAGVEQVGIVGGERTIRSGIYHRELAACGIGVRGRIAQPLSGMIERGEHHGRTFDTELGRILHPLRRSGTLLLACTHYPAATAAFARFLPATRLLDPVDHLLERTLRTPGRISSEGKDRIFTTGSPAQTQKGAAAAFGLRLQEIERIVLSSSSFAGM